MPPARSPRRRRAQPKSEETRRVILDRALALFRRHGFEGTTMRAIAAEAGLSLGAAYYYFRSKEEIVLAYYAAHQDEHTARFRAAAASAPADVATRLALLLETKLDLLQRERRLLAGLFGALFQSVGQPGTALSVFSADTAAVRRDSIALCQEALEGGGMSRETSELLAPGVWLAMLGVLLYFMHDQSPRQARTRKLISGASPLVGPLLLAAASPMAAPMRASVDTLLRETGLRT